MPKGSDCPRAVRSMFSLGASEGSADERPVKWNSRQSREGQETGEGEWERGRREMETELFFFIFGRYFSHFLFSFLI